MKSLQTVQKTFRVFRILAKVAFVFCIVGASACALGALCCSVWRAGGQVFSLFGEPVTPFSGGEDLIQMQAGLYARLIYLAIDAVLLGIAGRYFKIEQAEGTPFTQRGADLMLRLGVRCIWMPIVSIVLASVVTVCLGATGSGDAGNLPSLATGIVLILASLIFRYGAELAEENRLLSGGQGGTAVDR